MRSEPKELVLRSMWREISKGFLISDGRKTGCYANMLVTCKSLVRFQQEALLKIMIFIFNIAFMFIV